MSRSLKLLLRFGATGALLAIVLSHAHIPELGTYLSRRTVPAIGLGLAIFLCSQAAAALRWRTVLGPEAPPWVRLYQLYLIGGFFNLFLPTSVGGDAVRGASLAKTSGRPAEAFTSLVADRLLGMSALVLYGIIGILNLPALARRLSTQAQWRVSETELLIAGLGFAALLLGMFFVFRRRPALRRAGEEAAKIFARLAQSPALLSRGLALGLVSQGLLVALWGLLAWSVGLTIPISLLLLAVPVASLAALLPVSIGGLGVRDGAWLVLLEAAGFAAGPAVASSLLYFVVTLLSGALGGLVFISRGMTLEINNP